MLLFLVSGISPRTTSRHLCSYAIQHKEKKNTHNKKTQTTNISCKTQWRKIQFVEILISSQKKTNMVCKNSLGEVNLPKSCLRHSIYWYEHGSSPVAHIMAIQQVILLSSASSYSISICTLAGYALESNNYQSSSIDLKKLIHAHFSEMS